MLYTVFIVNKAGGLIYSKDLNPIPRLGGGNEYLRLASTFHSLHAIAKQLAPLRSGGIEVVDGPGFSLFCLETPTGLKLFATARVRRDSPNNPPAPQGVHAVSSPSDVTSFLRQTYAFYADYVLKHPFYEIDMPIRVRLFDAAIEGWVRGSGMGTGVGMSPEQIAAAAAATAAAAAAAAAGAAPGSGTGGSAAAAAGKAGGASVGGGAAPLFSGTAGGPSSSPAPMFSGSATS